jgi:ribonuclease HII
MLQLPLGPVCGPMTMCGYLIDESKLVELKELNVKDSKMLTEKIRRNLAPKLKRLADDFVIFSIPAKEIDKLRTISNLNALEISRMQQIINLLRTDKVIIDSPEVNTNNFSRKIMAKVRNKNIKIICENFADKKYPEVSAASILAKVERDAAVKKLHKQHGFFGSGYCHDEITIAFLKDWIKKNKEFPNFVRKSWFTAQWIKEESEQLTIGKFLGD